MTRLRLENHVELYLTKLDWDTEPNKENMDLNTEGPGKVNKAKPSWMSNFPTLCKRPFYMISKLLVSDFSPDFFNVFSKKTSTVRIAKQIPQQFSFLLPCWFTFLLFLDFSCCSKFAFKETSRVALPHWILLKYILSLLISLL